MTAATTAAILLALVATTTRFAGRALFTLPALTTLRLLALRAATTPLAAAALSTPAAAAMLATATLASRLRG
jgi:hypothetical protein